MGKRSFVKRVASSLLLLTMLFGIQASASSSNSSSASNKSIAGEKSSNASSSASSNATDASEKSEGTVLLPRDQEWKYNDEGKDLGQEFINPEYDSSSWKKGKAPLGFGNAFSETDPTLPLATEVSFGPDENNKYMTTYAVTEFDVSSLKDFKTFECYIHVDDGAVVYINGKEAFRKGIDDKEEVKFDTPAKFSSKEETFNLPVDVLKEGKNTVAVEIHQDGGDSSDLWFEMGITGKTEEAKVTDWTTTPVPNPEVKADKVSRVVVTFHGDTKTSKGFTWYTNQGSAGSDVEIIEKTEEKDPKFDSAMKFKGEFKKSTNAPEYVMHKAVADGLEAGKEYMYRVGDAEIGLWSEVGEFRTADNDGKFTFIDLADPQAKTEVEAELSASTMEISQETAGDHDFMMINGDVVDTGANEDQWGWVLDAADNTALSTTLMAAAGNHDEDPESFIEHFNLKVAEGSDTKTGAYYSYDYENAHFVVLNNNEDSKEYRDFTPQQIEWLKKDVAEAKKNPEIQWVIAVTHKGPYTTSNHATDEDIKDENGVRTFLPELMTELGVDLVLQGHDHIYARTLPIKNGEAAPATAEEMELDGQKISYDVNPEGTVYMIPATAGPKVYYKNPKMDEAFYALFAKADENSAAVYGPDPSDPKRPARSNIQTFVKFSVDGNKLSAVVYEIDRKKGGDPYVIDTFGIIKK